MTLLALLRALVETRSGLEVSGQDALRWIADPALKTDALRAAILENKASLVSAVDESSLRTRWRIPAGISISPRERARLAWLSVEWDSAPRYTVQDRAERLDLYQLFVANGLPQHEADIESTFSIVSARQWQQSTAPNIRAAA